MTTQKVMQRVIEVPADRTPAGYGRINELAFADEVARAARETGEPQISIRWCIPLGRGYSECDVCLMVALDGGERIWGRVMHLKRTLEKAEVIQCMTGIANYPQSRDEVLAYAAEKLASRSVTEDQVNS
jgi:hypothetical protein